MEHIWTMLMHKILQNHLLCAFVANLKIDANYMLYPESFCDKNLAIRKVFAFCDSARLRHRGIPPTPPLLAACSTRSMSRRICSSVRWLWPLLWNHGCFLSSSTTRRWFYTHTQGKYAKDKKALVQNSRDGRGSFFSRGGVGQGQKYTGRGIVVGD